MERKNELVCPWWLGFVLVNPIRRMYHNPEKILSQFVKPGMKVVDFGCAMGYFTLPMARLVGEAGVVYAIDIQKKMIDWLLRRAVKEQQDEIIQPILITENTDFAELKGRIDFALLFAMVHEVPDKMKLFGTMANMLKPGGKVLFAEPKGHVSLADFEDSVAVFLEAGFALVNGINIKGSHAAVLQKR